MYNQLDPLCCKLQVKSKIRKFTCSLSLISNFPPYPLVVSNKCCNFAYKALLYQLSVKQKQVLQTIAQEGKVGQIMSQRYLRKYSLTANTIQAAVKVLLDRDFITFDENIYLNTTITIFRK